MKPFPLTILLYHQHRTLLRREYDWLSFVIAFTTLGIGFPLGFLSGWLMTFLLGIHDGTMVDQRYGLLWLVLSGFGLIFWVFVGYLASFALLGLVLRTCYRWTWKRVGELMFESRLPRHWASSPDGMTPPMLNPGEAAARERFVAQLREVGLRLRPWILCMGVAALAMSVAARSHRRVDEAHLRLYWWMVSGFGSLVLVAGPLWLWQIMRRYAPKCPGCRRVLVGAPARRVLNTGRCPLCHRPLFP